jgi:hypothetical protein
MQRFDIRDVIEIADDIEATKTEVATKMLRLVRVHKGKSSLSIRCPTLDALEKLVSIRVLQNDFAFRAGTGNDGEFDVLGCVVVRFCHLIRCKPYH